MDRRTKANTIRKALGRSLVLLAFGAVPALLLAQSAPSGKAPKPGHPLDPADVATLTGRPAPAMPPAANLKRGHPLDLADVDTLTGRGPFAPFSTWRPKPGHPLDPADVDILTGKAAAPAQAAYPSYYYMAPPAYYSPYGYYRYGIDPTLARPSLFAPVSTATEPPFVPRLLGEIGGNPFVVIGTTTLARPSLFFFSGGSRKRSGVVILPARPASRPPQR